MTYLNGFFDFSKWLHANAFWTVPAVLLLCVGIILLRGYVVARMQRARNPLKKRWMTEAEVDPRVFRSKKRGWFR